MTDVTLTDAIPADADALVVAAVARKKKAELAEGHPLTADAATYVQQAMTALDAGADKESTCVVVGVPGVSCPVTVVGLGDTVTPAVLRRATGAALRGLRGRTNVAVAMPTTTVEELAAVAEGAHLGTYRYIRHLSEKKQKDAKKAPEKVQLVTSLTGDEAAKQAVRRAAVLGNAVSYARDLVNTPPNVLYPETFAASVVKHAPESVTITVHDEKALAKLGCGAILGVGLGSGKPPRIVEMAYAPKGAQKHIAYVGKGVTFDSGGLCLKPGEGMITMKCDMAGAAAVAGAMVAIAELELPVKVTAYLCLVENMTGPDAQRPGDVVTAADGTTIEIINTDAEGRLAMADGICLAARTDAELILDIATLTGAAVGALGNRTAAVLGTDDAIRDEIKALGEGVGENFWPIPIVEEIRPAMKSEVADLKHTGGRVGGMMTAGRFLQEFVGKNTDGEETTWAHLDIAGPAFVSDSPWGFYTAGGTGFGVATLVALAEARAAK